MIVGSAYYPGLRQRITLQNSPSEPGADERILLTGYRASTASADFDLSPQRMVSADDAIALFKEGSQLALMVRAAFAVGPLARDDTRRGRLPEIWAMATEPPVDVADAAAEFTLTWTGPATADAEIPIEVANERGIIQVRSGDTADTIAAKADTVIQGLQRNLPVTSGSAAAVTTLTAREKGAHTNELFLYADVRRAPGVGVTVAKTVNGVGIIDTAPIFSAASAADWAIVVLPQQDTLTRDAIKPHLQAMWDEDAGLRRRVIMPHGGLLTAAAIDAQEINDWRAIVACAERRLGVGTEWDPRHSARSSSTECAAALAARLESQGKANWNFNQASLPVRGRPKATLSGAEYDVARNAGVSVILDAENSAGRIADPLTTATKDQTGVTNLTNRTFLPAEIARVVRAVAALHAAKDAGFAQADSTSDSATAQDIKAAGLSALGEAARAGWIREVSDADVVVYFTTEDGAEVAVREESYAVIVGIDVARVEHLVTRA